MKKIKFFLSFLKERDWLEELATQGWVLTNMNLGFIYHFQQAEPCAKVYEIDRFSVSSHSSIQELNARKFAIDVAGQSDWKVVTHDEEMNYYFIKDKADDESDEFYDDDSRLERAERYRKRYCYEAPAGVLTSWLICTVIYLLLFLLMPVLLPEIPATIPTFFALFYIILTTLEIGCALFYIKYGQLLYAELSLSREEWEQRKQLSVKKHFDKEKKLLAFLQKQSESGLALVGYENGKYLFKEDFSQYDYFIDTKADLKKRLKKQGIRFKDEKKDISSLSLKWYEMSMADAEQYGLKPIGIIKTTALIYKRVHSDEPLPLTGKNKRIQQQAPTLIGAAIALGSGVIGFAIGFLAAHWGI